MMPASIRPEYYQVRFRFFRAEKLPAMDTAIFGGKGKIDAYIKCRYMNKELKTDVKLQKEGGSLDWDQEFLVIHSPLMIIDSMLNSHHGKQSCDEALRRR